MSKPFILLSFNELNFDYLKEYNEFKKYKNFSKILNNVNETVCNEEYKNLEPWIQWPTIYSGKTAKDHGIFRLGDCLTNKNHTIFNELENKGKTVGVLSSMNVENNLKKPDFFIPDPWTNTPPDNSYWSKKISKTINYFVINNSKLKFELRIYYNLIIILLKYAKFKNYPLYIKLFLTSFDKNWRKALFLDLLLNDIFLNLISKFKTNFSNLFLNGVAHIQHHYFFNSVKIKDKKQQNPTWYLNKKYDPLDEAFEVYDRILGDYLSLEKFDFMIATGLTQIPYDRTKYYYKLIKHKNFFKKLNLDFDYVIELMSRDFIIKFQNNFECEKASEIIKCITDSKKKKLFGDIQIKKNDLFVSLTYDEEITDQKVFLKGKLQFDLKDYVNFVALKNGMHNQKGYIYFRNFEKNSKIKIENIKREILKNI